jgi:predicted metal-dependent peptidase
MLMGKSVVVDEEITAYTDGYNKKYGNKFISKLTDQELRALVLHENLHVALKHIGRFKNEFKDNPHLMNASADYVVNDVITHLNDKSLCKLPDGGLYHDKFHNWSVKQVYDYLKKENSERAKNAQSLEGEGSGDGDLQGGKGDGNSQGGKGMPTKTLDEHDFSASEQMTPEQVGELSDKIDRALRQGGILAGRMGSKMPRAIEELLAPKIDWRHELRDFVTSSTKGSDEFTWRRFNKRLMANDIYMPSLETENVGELIIAIDTSGSIGSLELTEFASELASICSVCSPSGVRVLWWDTEVHGEQKFEPSQYGNIAGLLKPLGGGGTHVSSVSEYINKHKIVAEGVIVFTDGYVENDIQWNISAPTMWLVTQNENLKVPSGKIIKKGE